MLTALLHGNLILAKSLVASSWLGSVSRDYLYILLYFVLREIDYSIGQSCPSYRPVFVVIRNPVIIKFLSETPIEPYQLPPVKLYPGASFVLYQHKHTSSSHSWSAQSRIASIMTSAMKIPHCLRPNPLNPRHTHKSQKVPYELSSPKWARSVFYAAMALTLTLWQAGSAHMEEKIVPVTSVEVHTLTTKPLSIFICLKY